MDSTIIAGALITSLIIGALLLKGYIDKRRIEQAREVVDLNDDLRRMQNAFVLIPSLYLEAPTSVFILKRTLELTHKILANNPQLSEMIALQQDVETQLDSALKNKNDSGQTLNKRGDINNPDTAHDIRAMVKYLHTQTIRSVKTGLIPKAHGARVVKNLTVIMQRTVIDMNYNIARVLLKTQKLRPALSKYKATLRLVTKSPIREHLVPLKGELDSIIAKIEQKLDIDNQKNNESSGGELASGMDKIKQEEDWDVKKNIYD